jgi:hypothetical protein
MEVDEKTAVHVRGRQETYYFCARLQAQFDRTAQGHRLSTPPHTTLTGWGCANPPVRPSIGSASLADVQKCSPGHSTVRRDGGQIRSSGGRREGTARHPPSPMSPSSISDAAAIEIDVKRDCERLPSAYSC